MRLIWTLSGVILFFCRFFCTWIKCHCASFSWSTFIISGFSLSFKVMLFLLFLLYVSRFPLVSLIIFFHIHHSTWSLYCTPVSFSCSLLHVYTVPWLTSYWGRWPRHQKWAWRAGACCCASGRQARRCRRIGIPAAGTASNRTWSPVRSCCTGRRRWNYWRHR